MVNLASVNDVNSLWKPLSHAEQEQVEALLPVVSDSLRQEAKRVGKNLDKMITEGDVLPNVVKSVVVDIISRYLEQLSSDNASTLSQESMSILKKDLKRLGLTRQRFGMVDLYGIH